MKTFVERYGRNFSLFSLFFSFFSPTFHNTILKEDNFHSFKNANTCLGYIKGQASSRNSGSTLKHVCACE